METTKININKLENNKGQIEGLPANPRFIKSDKFDKLKKSIENNPEMLSIREIVAYDNNGELIVVMGNMRLRACKELKFKEVEVKILPFETSLEKLKAYTIIDNAGFGEWDFDILANEFDILDLEAWGVDLPKFELEEDYSDKNKEIDTDEFSEKLILKFELSEKEYHFIVEKLSKINASKETALLQMLKYESQI